MKNEHPTKREVEQLKRVAKSLGLRYVGHLTREEYEKLKKKEEAERDEDNSR